MIKNIDWVSMSDAALTQMIGTFVNHYRLVQNKTQEEVAYRAKSAVIR